MIVAGRLPMWALALCAAAVLPALILPSCSSRPVAATVCAEDVQQSAADSAVKMLRSGDILLRMGLGADSYMLAKMNRKNRSYSHCGIVMVEHGYPFVYHAIGGEDNPDARLRRDSAGRFLAPRRCSAIGIARFDLDSASVRRLRAVVAAYYRAAPKFDLSFDLSTDDRLYCSEFVYKALNKAMRDTSYIGVTTYKGMRYVGIDDIFLNRHARTVFATQFKFKCNFAPYQEVPLMNRFLRAFGSAFFAVIMAAGCGKDSPDTVARYWLTSFYHMDYDVAKKFSTESTKNFISGLEQFTDAVSDSERKELRKATIAIKDVKVNGDHASLVYTVSDMPGKDQPLSLVKQGDHWLVEFSKADQAALPPDQPDTANMSHQPEPDTTVTLEVDSSKK